MLVRVFMEDGASDDVATNKSAQISGSLSEDSSCIRGLERKRRRCMDCCEARISACE